LKQVFDSIYIFGDSFAHNPHVETSELFASLVANYYKLPLFNYGVGGYGNESIFKKIYEVVPTIEFKNPLIMVVYTCYLRKEIYNPKGKRPRNIDPEFFTENFVKDYFAYYYDEKTLLVDTLTYINAVQVLLKTYNFEYIEMFSNSNPESTFYYNSSTLKINSGKFLNPPCLHKICPDDRFELHNDGIKNGHFTASGNKKVADLIISTLDQYYYS